MVEKIGEGLIQMGAMTETQREDILKMQEEGDDRLFGEIAIVQGFINDDILMEYLNNLTI